MDGQQDRPITWSKVCVCVCAGACVSVVEDHLAVRFMPRNRYVGVLCVAHLSWNVLTSCTWTCLRNRHSGVLAMVLGYICCFLFLLSHRARGEGSGGLATPRGMGEVVEDCSMDTEVDSFSGSESSHGDIDVVSPEDRRVSLGSLFKRQQVEPSTQTPASLPTRAGQVSATPEQVPDALEHGREATFGNVSIWFNGSGIPHDAQEVLSWHPNRVRAALITEMYSRLQHLKPQRTRKKQFEPVREFMQMLEKTEAKTGSSTTARNRTTARDLYFRVLYLITGSRIRDLRKSHAHRWSDTTQADKSAWYLVHRIIHHGRVAHVLDFPKTHVGGASQPGPDPNKKPKTSSMSWSGYGFTLSYNTNLGQEDPDVIKLVQSGKVGPDLYKGMRTMEIYNEAFADLWDFANTLAKSKNFATVNIGLEHSSHGDFEARVHFHVFIGPDVRGGIGFAWNPTLVELKSDEVVWRGIGPNVKACRPQKRSCNQIYQSIVTGSYYVAGPKIGSIMKRSTFSPIEDSESTYHFVRVVKSLAAPFFSPYLIVETIVGLMTVV